MFDREVAELLAADMVAEWQDLELDDAAFDDFFSGDPIPE